MRGSPCGQVAAVAFGEFPAFECVFPKGQLRSLLFDLGKRNLKILESQLPVVLAQFLGLPAVERVMHLGDQVLLAPVDLFELRNPRGLRLERRAILRRQGGQIEIFDRG